MRMMGVGLLLAIAAVAYSAYCYRMPMAKVDTTVTIPPRAGTRATLAQLYAEGLAPAPYLVALPLYVSGDYKWLKAGEYAVAAGDSPKQILARMVRGDIIVHKLTVPEGWTRYQLRDALRAEPLLTGDVGEITEGSAFPDTMHFTRGESRAAIIGRMQAALQKHLAAAWEARAEGLPLATAQEALVLASIVERETGVSGERAKVAGVFMNRLRLGMPLQSDPTVAYGVEALQAGAPLGRALTTADLRRDTPYNSYTRTGLPPTPICLVGKAALEAALHPEPTDALYFVATGTGGHVFAATLAEHHANVAAYRARMRASAR